MSRLVCLLYRYFALNVLTKRHINSRFFCFVHFDQRAPQMRVKLIPEITQPGVEADTLIILIREGLCTERSLAAAQSGTVSTTS